MMRYKNPKNFSATEKTVTYAAVLYMFSLLKMFRSVKKNVLIHYIASNFEI